MPTQETVLTRKRPGPPSRGGKGHTVGVRLQPPDLAALDAWRVARDDSPSRPEAVRLLMRKGLGEPEG